MSIPRYSDSAFRRKWDLPPNNSISLILASIDEGLEDDQTFNDQAGIRLKRACMDMYGFAISDLPFPTPYAQRIPEISKRLAAASRVRKYSNVLEAMGYQSPINAMRKRTLEKASINLRIQLEFPQTEGHIQTINNLTDPNLKTQVFIQRGIDIKEKYMDEFGELITLSDKANLALRDRPLNYN